MTKEITKDSVSIHLFKFFHNITEILFQSYLQYHLNVILLISHNFMKILIQADYITKLFST